MEIKDQYAVFGQPIKHSKSPRIHQQFAEQTGQLLSYHAQEVSAQDFTAAADAFFASGGKGLNCTVPLKELAFAYAAHTTPRAALSQAVNTLARQADGSILGDNTDGIGLIRDLTVNHNIKLAGLRILLLGAGGASRGIIGPLLEHKPQTLVIANRTVEKAVKLALVFQDYGNVAGVGFAALGFQTFDLILNATSASLSDDLPPLPDGLLAQHGICYDLAYGNEPTAFVRWGHAQNAALSLDGLGMLVEQAGEAFLIWRGLRPNCQEVISELNAERR